MRINRIDCDDSEKYKIKIIEEIVARDIDKMLKEIKEDKQISKINYSSIVKTESY